MPYTQEDLEALDLAIASGELTVTIENRTITYRSIDQLLKARRFISNMLAKRAGKINPLGDLIVTRVDREVT